MCTRPSDLLAHLGLLSVPAPLHLLDNWWIIVASAAMFVIEIFANKVPAFDLIWNGLHTFIRVPIAALLGYAATSQLSPEKQRLATGDLTNQLALAPARPATVQLTPLLSSAPYGTA